MKKWLIKLLGGFSDVQTALDSIEAEDKEDKELVLRRAVQRLYNVIDSSEILRQDKDGSWLWRGRKLTSQEIADIQEEAAYWVKSKMWLILKQDIRYQIGKKVWEEGKVHEDLVWGQLLTFLDDIIRTRVNGLANTTRKNPGA